MQTENSRTDAAAVTMGLTEASYCGLIKHLTLVCSIWFHYKPHIYLVLNLPHCCCVMVRVTSFIHNFESSPLDGTTRPVLFAGKR